MNRVPFDPLRFEDSAISAAAEVHDGFRADVISGLSQVQKTQPCKYLYDEHGAQLFDAICRTPEYYPTLTEIAILRRHAGDISALAGSGVHLIELGSGACVKTRIVLDALASPRSYVPVDIAADGLFSEASFLQRDYPRLAVRPVYADFTRPFAIPAACAMGRKVGFFPGSTIGNFTPEEAARFLRRTAELLGRDGLLIIGVDLKKARRLLEDAYNDARGVTAAFNLNILRRINRELHANFDLAAFTHCASYNAARGRVEMHVYSLAFQSVRVDGRLFSFAPGESIHTENSHTYTVAEFQALAKQSGFTPVRVWTDEARLFSVHCLGVSPTS